MRYNHHFQNHFGSCRLIVEGHDPHRNRPIQVRLIPGEFEVVGLTDGVDAWIAPVSTAPSDLFDKVRRIIEDVKAGKQVGVTTHAVRERRKINTPTEDPPPTRERRVIASASPQTTNLQPRTRRVIHP